MPTIPNLPTKAQALESLKKLRETIEQTEKTLGELPENDLVYITEGIHKTANTTNESMKDFAFLMKNRKTIWK